MELNVDNRIIVRGVAIGKVVKSEIPISFFGGVDPKSGVILDENHPLFGRSLKDVILVIPFSKGSTVGSYVIYAMKKANASPAGILLRKMDMIIATGCILAKIPLMIIDQYTWDMLEDDDLIEIDANAGKIKKKRLKNFP